MKISYVAIFKKNDKYIEVNFPDLFGVVTFAETENEAITMAKDALKEAYYCKMLSDKNTSFEQMKKLFPNEECKLIEVEV